MTESPSLIKKALRPLLNNQVETGNSKWYPELEPRTYAAPARDVFEAAIYVVEHHRRWDLQEADPDDLRLDVEVHTKIFDWVDDLTIWVEHVEAGGTRVRARSASRVGTGDFGQNARTIREFFERLDQRVRYHK